MNIAVESWLKGAPITPDLKYGGIEHMTRNLALAFHNAGHRVTLIAPPGSDVSELEEVVETNDFWFALRYANQSNADFYYSNSCWDTSSPVRQSISKPFASTTHVTQAVGWSKNVIYLSYSQRKSHSSQLGYKLDNPIIPVPAPNVQPIGYHKDSYLLFLGIAAPWKGLHHAVELAYRLRRDLIVAGPAWGDYVDKLRKPWVHFIGEVYGDQKWELLEKAHAVCCLSDSQNGSWLEPGAGVVAEANQMNTPVAALNNGCLPEIVFPGINGWIGDTVEEVAMLMQLQPAEDPARFARVPWRVDNIAGWYLEEFNKIMNGKTYGN